MSIVDKIRLRLDDPMDIALNGGPHIQALRNVLAEADKIEAEAARQPGMYLVGKAIADQFRGAVAKGLGIEEQPVDRCPHCYLLGPRPSPIGSASSN